MMDAMKEAFKRHISKHQVKGKPVADNAEDPTQKFGKEEDEVSDNDPNVKSDHAPSLLGGDPMMDQPAESSDAHHEALAKDLVEKIKHALMGAGDHMGRSAMSLNERAKDSMINKMKMKK